MTIKEAWLYGRSQLAQTSPTPDLDARLLLQHILQVDHPYLIAHDDQRLTEAQVTAYQQVIVRARHREPIPYIIGHAPFYGLAFMVSPAVLIPRPETEQLVETAVRWANQHHPQHIADIGTGSGCIAITLARLLPHATIHAVDISPDALNIARQNATRHAPDRVLFYQGDLLTPLPHPPDMIIANLPYVSDSEWTQLDDGVKLYEPKIALTAGEKGLDLIQNLLAQATRKLKPGGAIFLEVGWQQGAAVRTLAAQYFPEAYINVLPDYAGHDRIVQIDLAT
ncbi:MAG: peptide chain release factor N(5)-glutamine methyltransferase [Chloroflexi bacterium]|nr:MAG: peptide chain release factor N(5)-glutamine methyltransferase [Chloroflexota bacterium]